MKTPYTEFYDSLQNSINTAWNEAEEIHSGLNEMTDEEIIDCVPTFIERASTIMSELHRYAVWENK